MQTVISHSSPDYRCDKPGCSYTGVNIIQKREFKPDCLDPFPDDWPDGVEEESLNKDDTEGFLARMLRQLCCRGPAHSD